MAAAVWGARYGLSLRLGDGLLARLIQVGVPTLVGILVYFLLALALGLEELQAIRRRIRRA